MFKIFQSTSLECLHFFRRHFSMYGTLPGRLWRTSSLTATATAICISSVIYCKMNVSRGGLNPEKQNEVCRNQVRTVKGFGQLYQPVLFQEFSDAQKGVVAKYPGQIFSTMSCTVLFGILRYDIIRVLIRRSVHKRSETRDAFSLLLLVHILPEWKSPRYLFLDIFKQIPENLLGENSVPLSFRNHLVAWLLFNLA